MVNLLPRAKREAKEVLVILPTRAKREGQGSWSTYSIPTLPPNLQYSHQYAEFCLVSESVVEKLGTSLIKGFLLIRSKEIKKFTDKVSPFDSVGQN